MAFSSNWHNVFKRKRLERWKPFRLSLGTRKFWLWLLSSEPDLVNQTSLRGTEKVSIELTARFDSAIKASHYAISPLELQMLSPDHIQNSLNFKQMRKIMTALNQLIELLKLEKIDDLLFRGASQDLGFRQVFGGQVVAQALSAAIQVAPQDRFLHSCHAYFLSPGDSQ